MRRYRYHHKKKNNGTAHHSGWQIVYTGFVLILLCFFIMLTSFASLEQSKITRFVKAFSQAVTVFNGGRSLEQGQSMINRNAMVVHKENQITLLFEQVRDLGQKNGLENIDLRKGSKGVVMTLADKMLFASGDAVLSVSAYPLLDKITAVVRMMGVPVEIEGHTDNVPISTDTYPSNWELSTARAVNVLRYITEKHNIPMNLLSAVGKSEYVPIAPNNSTANRNKNRRVEIIFKPK